MANGDDVDIGIQVRGGRAAERDLDRVTTRGVKPLGREADRTGRKAMVAGRKLDAMGKAGRFAGRGMFYAAAGVGAAGAALGAFSLVIGRRAFAEWREAGKINRVTAARIESTGRAAGLSVRQIGRLSRELSALTAIDDEQIQQTANRLLTFTAIKGDLFQPAVQAAIDMGAEFGNAGSAATMIGKALQDPVKGATALRRAGVNLSEQQQEQLETWVKQGETLKAQRWILRELQTEFGGTAAAQADGVDRMVTGWKNVEEAIGGVFGPGLNFAGNEFADFANRRLIPEIDEVARKMEGIWGPSTDASMEQRLDRSLALLRRRGKPLADVLGREIDQADIGENLADAFQDAFPHIAEAAGRGGGHAVRAFIGGWWDSPLWAKLFVLGAIAAKTGALTSVFGSLGSMAAKKFVAAMAPRIAALFGAQLAADAALGSAIAGSPRWKSLGRVAGRAFGIGLAITAGVALREMLKEDSTFGQYSGGKGWKNLGEDVLDWAPGEDSEARRRRERAEAMRRRRRRGASGGANTIGRPPRRGGANAIGGASRLTNPRTSGLKAINPEVVVPVTVTVRDKAIGEATGRAKLRAEALSGERWGAG